MDALLGFDCRETSLGGDVLWNAERRSTFLLSESATKPLSVDVLVWPTIFRNAQVECLRRQIGAARLGERGLARPAFIGPCQELWTNLTSLDAACTPAAHDGVVIAVTAKAHPLVREVEPLAGSVAATWPLLGYDVADEFLLSGLSNCGYSASDKRTAATSFGADLNEHHLFQSEEVAAEFARFTAARVREHAPFFVYGVRERPEQGRSGVQASQH